MPASARTPERVQAVLDGLSAGTPLTVVCREIGVDDDTVRDWASKDAELSGAIAHARILGWDAIAIEAVRITDTPPERTATEHGDKVDSGHVAWLKNRVETRLKLLAKWDPKRYGERTQVEHSGKLSLESLVAGTESKSE